MRVLVLGLLLASAPAAGQRLAYEDVLGMPGGLDYSEVEVAPEAGESGPVRAFYGDRLEWNATPDGDSYSWDVSAEVGSPQHRLWLALAGSGSFADGIDYAEGQILYSHPILAAGLALQAGIRRDFVRPRRSHAVLGLQGNVLGPLYVGLFGFLSTKEEVTARAWAYYDWEAAPRLIVQPHVGLSAATRDIPALGLGHGFTNAELGLRLRYRIAEPFAPYVGLRWDRLLGRTARLARQAGDDVESSSLVLGIRSYF